MQSPQSESTPRRLTLIAIARYGKSSFFYNIFQDKERDAAKSSKVPLAQLMNAFSQLCWIEKQYYSLTYLTPKRFLMKDVS